MGYRVTGFSANYLTKKKVTVRVSKTPYSGNLYLYYYIIYIFIGFIRHTVTVSIGFLQVGRWLPNGYRNVEHLKNRGTLN